MNLVASLKSLLPALSKQATETRQAMETLRERRTALQQERDTIMKAPLSREDYAEVVCADIDRAAAQREERMRNAIAGRAFGRRRYATFQSAVEVEKGRIDMFGPLGDPLLEFDSRSWRDPLDIPTAVWLFKDAVKDAVRAAILSIEAWPEVAPRTLAELRTRLAEIDEELSRIDSEMAEIKTVAERLGFDLEADIAPEIEDARANLLAAADSEPVRPEKRKRPGVEG